MKPSTLVTGGAGFIGSHLVERLLTDGYAVTVIDDCSTGSMDNLKAVARNPDLHVIRSKVSECNELVKIVAGVHCVFHLAAAVGVELVVNSPTHALKTNLHETEVLLAAAVEKGVPVLLTSTSEVYGKSLKAAFAEDDDLLIGPPNHARWSYACSKLMDEFLALAYARERQLPVTVVRLFNIAGPRQTGRYGMVLPRFIAAARNGQPLKVHDDGRQTRSFCYVKDGVEALVRLQRNPAARGEVINVGSTEEITILDLAKLVVAVLGSASPLEFVSYAQAYAPGFEDMRRRKPQVDKLVRLTGFRPETSLRAIIELTAAAI
ncbi:MAG TPA: NAD-dependent epimerase/dehydratase family protein [Verrucomicrobiae bacterium]|nr:NAD-dependent epimerase/dehydratase family protein [Verrucomicrobiae bacterium]